MHIARRPLTVRSSVLAASVAVLASVLVAPSALAQAPSGGSGDVETGDRLVGEVVQAWAEPASLDEAVHEDAGPLTFVESPDGRSIRVPTEDLADVPVGATVAVTVGREVHDAPEREDGLAAAREVLSASVVGLAAAPPVTAQAGQRTTNAVTVVRVVPSGGREDATTVQTLTSVVNGPVAAFWGSQTAGRVQFAVTGAVPGWVRSPAACSDPAGLWRSAADAAGWSGAPGQHLLVYVSSLPQDLGGCSLGLAEVGTSPSSGGRLSVRTTSTSVIAHELGHNLGLGHSSQMQCDRAVETGGCERSPYRDLYDVMGGSWGQLGSLNAPQSARLGFLPEPDTAAFSPGSASGTVSLVPIGSTGGVRAIRLTASDGTVYWIECRGAVGQDAWLATSANTFRLQAGVVVRRSSSDDDTSLLLDATPSPRASWASDLAMTVPAGTVLPLAGGEFTVTVRDGGSRALVEVATGAGGGGVGGSGSRYFLNDALTGRANTEFSYGDAGDQVLVGDWDGNGTDTLAVRRGNRFFVKNDTRSGAADTVFDYGDPGDAVLVGDWDGNGTDTLAVRRGIVFHVKNDTRSGVADAVFAYGNPGDAVLVGDWDGNGTSTLTVRRGGRYFVKNDTLSGVADRTFDYGSATDVVLVGRWSARQTGDSLVVRRGNWYLVRYSLTSGRAEFEFGYGEPTDTAFVGDWDGDGVDGIGVRR